MAEYHLKTPFSEDEIRRLVVGDTVYLTGKIFTARDEAHKKMLETYERRKKIPFNPAEMAMFHCGPIIKKKNGKWFVVAAGPTTSSRMELFEDKFIEFYRTRMIIGKGGMGERTTEAMKKHGAVYVAYTGGAAVLAVEAIKEVEDVYWLDELGMPEAVWIMRVENFGPLIVTIDSHGRNLAMEIMEKVEKKKLEIIKNL